MHRRWIKTISLYSKNSLYNAYLQCRCRKISRDICTPSRIHQGVGIRGCTGSGTDQWMSSWSQKYHLLTRFEQIKHKMSWFLTVLFPVTQNIQGRHHLQSCWPADQPARSQPPSRLPRRSRSDPGSVLWSVWGERMSGGSPHHWTLCPCSGCPYGVLCFATQSGKIFSTRKL